MKPISRFDCLKENSKKSSFSKKRNKQKKSFQGPQPKHIKEPASVPTQEPKHEPTHEPTHESIHESAQEPEPAPIISWKDRIKATKETNDPFKPIRGSVIIHMDKKTKKISRIEHPDDIVERQRRNEIREQERLYQCYLDYRTRVINYFIYDIEMGNRDDFNTVEDFIEYLDKSDESDIEEDEEEYYDSQDENGSQEEY